MSRSQVAEALSVAALAMAAVFVAKVIFLGEASIPWIAGAAMLQLGRVFLDWDERSGRR